jgi:hypothetical protein
MKPEQALELLSKASAQYKGTLEEHQMLLEAVRVLQTKLAEPKLNAKAAKTPVKAAK